MRFVLHFYNLLFTVNFSTNEATTGSELGLTREEERQATLETILTTILPLRPRYNILQGHKDS